MELKQGSWPESPGQDERFNRTFMELKQRQVLNETRSRLF